MKKMIQFLHILIFGLGIRAPKLKNVLQNKILTISFETMKITKISCRSYVEGLYNTFQVFIYIVHHTQRKRIYSTGLN